VATPKEYTATLSSLKAAAATASGKSKNLAAQMREKAAAAYRKEAVDPEKHSQLRTPSDKSANLLEGSAKKAVQQQNDKLPQVLSPLDTYEISDREDSDTDDNSESDSDNEKQKKKVCVIEFFDRLFM
jgi:hypothetical protein